VVTYQSTVNVLVPATKMHDREAVRAAIRRIRAGGNTALFAGVSKGARELRKFLDRNRVNTLLLLSDGLANVGPSSPGELAQLGASLGREGITVTTIGLGLHYNEDLMTRLAMASDGNHFFVEDERDLEAAFATEFSDALSAVAHGVTIHIHCSGGVRPIRLLGRKAQIVGRDEREENLRRVLNFGHTVGHALETLSGYQGLRHGEAVGWGMIAATHLAERRGKLSAAAAQRILRLVRAVGRLPRLPRLSAQRIYEQLFADKKKHEAGLRFVLPRRVGQVEIVGGIPRPDVLASLRQLDGVLPAQ